MVGSGAKTWAICLSLVAASVAVGVGRAAGQALPPIQKQADITPWIVDQPGGGTDQHNDDIPGVKLETNLSFTPDSYEVAIGCIPSADANLSVNLLRFSLYTRNDGYEHLQLDHNSEPQFYTPFFPPPQGSPEQYLFTNFANFTLVDATTGLVAHRTNNQHVSVPAVGKKTEFTLATDGPMVYRAGSVDGEAAPNGIPGLSFVAYGQYDDYALDVTRCQWVQVDGLPDGDYDLVVEENTPRLVTCDSTNDADCTFDGRVNNNVSAMRLHIATVGGTQTVTPCPWTTPSCASLPSTPTAIGPSSTGGPPAVISRNVDTYELFYVGTDSNLHTLHQDTALNPHSQALWPTGEGPIIYNAVAAVSPLAGTVAAVSGDPNRVIMDAFAPAANGDVVRVNYANGVAQASVYGPVSQGYGTFGTPAAASSGPKSAMVAWMTRNNRVAFGLWNGTSWSTPQLISANFPPSQTPALVSSGDGVYHLFVQDGGGGVIYKRYSNGVWGGWHSLGAPAGGAVIGNVTAVSPYMNRADAFVTAADHKLYHLVWYGLFGSDMFTAWSNDNPGVEVGAAPTAISTGVRSMDVFYYDYRHPLMAWNVHFDGTGTVDPDLGQPPAPPAPWPATKTNIGSITTDTPSWPIVIGSWADHTYDVFQRFLDGAIAVRSLR